jgi:hypothetical protein
MYKAVVILFFLPSVLSGQKLIHVVVALCDNKCQGIVPVPEKIGDGENQNANLYWGCGYGVRNFFDKKTAEWTLVSKEANPRADVLERCIFEHTSTGSILVADAYRGCAIERAMNDFFLSCSGKMEEEIDCAFSKGKKTINLENSDLVSWVGHDGLMDFSIDNYPKAVEDTGKQAIMLACISSEYFTEGIQAAKVHPLLWTRGLMAPEAYTLEAAVTAFVNNKGSAEIEKAAEVAYQKYQGVSQKGANWLFKTGW